jgi:hypothetical protein
MTARRSRKTRPSRVPVPAPETTRIAGWLLIALAAPRVIRLLYPAVWVEDDLYLESAFAIARGLKPYVDFAHPQMPVLEWLAAAYIRIAGASHLRMEVLNGAAIYATSVLVFALGRGAIGRQAATAGALLFACSSLVFRYHVWAREFFVSALVLGAAIAALDRTMTARRQVALAAGLLSLACGVKLTAGIPAAVVLAFLLLVERRVWRAAAAASAIGGMLGLLSAFCYWQYGSDFVFQAFLFHFLKGRDPAGAGPLYPASILDVLAPLFVLGAARLALNRSMNRALGLVVALLTAEYLFYGVLSPTAWGHNYLEILPYIAIIAGAGAAWVIDAVRGVFSDRGQRVSSVLRLAAGAAVIATFLLWVTPLSNENWERGSVYGFGFVPRDELSTLANALRAATSDREEVIAPSFICFEANRLQLVRYPENYAVMREAEASYRAEGFEAARARLGQEDFFDLITRTSHIWNERIVSGLAVGGPVNAVIVDSPIQLLPLVNASDEALAGRQFRPALQTAHYTLWIRAGATSRSPR